MSDLQHGPSDEYEDFGDGPIYEEGRSLSPLTKVLVIAAICVAGVAFASLVWFAYNEGVRNGAEETAPVLQADSAPVKRKPDDPGGMDIPHQDKLVYQRIAPGQAQQPVERLLPPPEMPVERPVPAAPAPGEPAADVPVPPAPAAETPSEAETSAIDSAEPSAGGTTIGQAVDQTTGEATAGEEEGGGSTPFVRERDVRDADGTAKPDSMTTDGATQEPATSEKAEAAAAPAPPPASETAQQAAAPPPTPEPAGPAWRIQLAALTSESGARKAWDRLQRANDDLLGDLALNVQRADLSTGTYYRIQAGPLADRAAASALCGKLKTRNQDCLVVAP